MKEKIIEILFIIALLMILVPVLYFAFIVHFAIGIAMLGVILLISLHVVEELW